uniref:Uncharacterized protein n=1 Tax=Felis catus TaxID=9685 RepID=A0ABI7YYR0_FELCA
ISSRWGQKGALPSYRRNGLVVKIKHESNLLDLSTVSNGDFLAGLAVPGPKALHGFHDVHAFLHHAKHHVLAIQPLGLGGADEKLGTVRVGSGVRHGQDARTCVLQDEILVVKLLPVDGLASSAIMACEVTTLAHKSRDNPVKAGTFVTKSFLPSAESTKILCCLGNFVCKQLEGDAAQGLAVHGDVKEHGGVDHG